MLGLGLSLNESMGSQRQDYFVNLERRRDQDVNVPTTYTSRSKSQSGSHLSHEGNTKAMQLEIDHLKRKVRHERRRRTPSNFDDEEDGSYKSRSRTSLSESFSYDEDYNHERKIGEGRLSRRFTQSTFTMYNGRTDLVENVSHFNQRMTVHSKNEALMCKVFPSSLGPMAMKWFDGLGVSSINSFKELTRVFGSRFITCSRVPRPLRFLVVHVYARREDLENVLGQILGDVQ